MMIRFILGILGVLAVQSALAAPYTPVHPDPVGDLHRWQALPDLSGVEVRCMAQEPDGTLWVGTDLDIRRHDGRGWTLYAGQDSLPGVPAHRLRVARDGSVWAATQQGLFRFDGRWSSPQALRGLPCYDLWEARDGSLWVATSWGAARLLGQGTVTFYATAASLDALQRALPGRISEVKVIPDSLTAEVSGLDLSSICQDREGSIWLGFRNAPLALRYEARGERWQAFRVGEGTPSGAGTRLFSRPAGPLWATSGDRGTVRRFDGQAWERVRFTFADPASAKSAAGSALIEGRDGTLWVGGEGFVLALRPDRRTLYRSRRIPIPGPVLDLMEGRDGSLFVGTPDGVLRYEGSTDRYQPFEGLHIAFQARDGSLWFVSQDSALVRRDGSEWTRHGVSEGVIDAPVCVLEDAQGVIWAAGSHRGAAAVCRLRGGSWARQTFPEAAPRLTSACLLADTLWFGAGGAQAGQTGGLLSFQGTRWQRLGQDRLRVGDIRALAGTRFGLWVGGSRGLRRVSGQAWDRVEEPKAFPRGVSALHAAPDGDLWVHTGDEVLRYDGQAWQAHPCPHDPLAPPGPAWIASTCDGAVWTSGQDAHSARRFDGRQWSRKAVDLKAGVSGAGMLEDREQGLWFNGLGKTQPPGPWRTLRYLPDRDPPETLLKDPIAFVPPPGQAAFAWSGKDPFDDTPEQDLLYAYRIDGGAWSPFLGQTRLSLSALSDGFHSIEVRARDRDLHIDPTPATHWFRVVPPLWKNKYALGLLLFLVLIIGVQAARLSRANRSLQTLDRLKSEFVSLVSHDLRTPLAAAQVHIDNLLDGLKGPLTAPQTRSLHHVKGSVDRLGRMIEDLLDLSRIEAGQLVLSPETFDLHQAVHEVVEGLRPVAHQKGLDLRPLSPSDPVGVRADWDRIVQVLTNLLGNALKFTPAGGRVEVHIEQTDGVAQVCVWDTGPGIPPDQHEAIFERFHQLQKEGQGTGLGLSISKELIEMHKGRLWVEGQVGQGSRFLFTLPQDKPPEPAGEPVAGAGQRPAR